MTTTVTKSREPADVAAVPVEDKTARGRVWRQGTLVDEDFDFAKISDYPAEDGRLTWIDLCDPDHARLGALADELTLQPLAVEDAISEAERAKATRYATHTFMTVYAVKVDPDVDESSSGSALMVCQISAFILPRGLITVRPGPEFDIEDVVKR